MHAKSDSEVTSLEASTPPRSPRRLLYYVQSPSQLDAEKMSYGSSPVASPHHYRCSPIHHSRESSASRFSASLKNSHRNAHAWKRVHGGELDGVDGDGDVEEGGGGVESSAHSPRSFAACFVLSFAILFTAFSLILWGASKSYEPHVLVKMKPFYQKGRSQRNLTVIVRAIQLPLYGAMSLGGGSSHGDKSEKERVNVALNLTFSLRSRAYILGKLVKSKFHKNIRCPVTLDGNRLGKPQFLKDSCF
ncbi:hypothetical protein Nepgr_025487 [Nepenthes gracilis]|uniref:Late embryogenesis abundant protein LEA-2 subgroup domain-containing protein n=1 Tax=Nepenthes gracilis TaxID=150966 RepID=A0AAD3T6Z2_NEPGR|nr:hypothetical protein Nepgr_025487 [Nepenthes gracilis]